MLALAAYSLHVPMASSELNWQIATNPFVLPSHSALRIFYTVQNDSPVGDANNLIRFSIGAGTNVGVYSTTQPSGWVSTIDADETTFFGNGGYIPSNGGGTFSVYSTYLSTSVGEAGALAEGFVSDPFVPFPSHGVLVPSLGEDQVKLSILEAGELLELSCEGLWPGRTNVLYSGESVSVLTNALYEFESLGFLEVLELPLTNSMGFFRLKAGR